MVLDKIAAKKLGMLTFFNEDGEAVPGTLLQVFDHYVVRSITPSPSNRPRLQVAYCETHQSKLNRPHLGNLRKNGVTKHLRYLIESSVSDPNNIPAAGTEIKGADLVSGCDLISVRGKSKGKGFAGVIKRYHFHGGDATHGATTHRKPQSNNATDPARVFLGSRRPGRMGNRYVTVKSLRVMHKEPERNLLVVKGSVPAPTGSIVFIRKET